MQVVSDLQGHGQVLAFDDAPDVEQGKQIQVQHASNPNSNPNPARTSRARTPGARPRILDTLIRLLFH